MLEFGLKVGLELLWGRLLRFPQLAWLRVAESCHCRGRLPRSLVTFGFFSGFTD